MKRLFLMASIILCTASYSTASDPVPMEQLVTVQIDANTGPSVYDADIYIYGECPTPPEWEDSIIGPGIRGATIGGEVTGFITFAHLIPWKKYNMLINRYYGMGDVNVVFTPPQGYDIVVDGIISNKMHYGSKSQVSFNDLKKIQVIPKIQYPQTRSGVSTSLAPGKVEWSVSLGESSTGESVGLVYLHEDNNVEDWSNLLSNLGVLLNTPEAYVLREPVTTSIDGELIGGNIIQVIAKDTIVDISHNSSNETLLEFYNISQCRDFIFNWESVQLCGVANSFTTGTYPDTKNPQQKVVRYSFEGKPFVKYLLKTSAEDNYTKLEIIKTLYDPEKLFNLNIDPIHSQITQVTRKKLNDAQNTIEWIVEDWKNIDGLNNVEVIVRTHSHISENEERNETINITQGNSTLFSIRNKYSLFPGLGETIIETKYEDLLTKYYYTRTQVFDTSTYWATSSFIGRSDGHSEAYEWDQRDGIRFYWPALGHMVGKYQPFLNYASMIEEGSIVKAGLYKVFEYDNQDIQRNERHYVKIENNESILVGKKEFYLTKTWDNLDYRIDARSYSSENEYTVYTELNNKVFYSHQMDYQGMLYGDVTHEIFPTGKQIYIEKEFGTYTDISTGLGTFQPDLIPHSAITCYAGLSFRETSITSHNGLLIEGLSEKLVNIRDQYGHIKEIHNYLYSDELWNIISWKKHHYNLANQLTEVHHSNGRIERYEYTGEYKTLYDDGNGIVTSYTYDNLGRVLTETVAGDSNLSGSITTKYEYNAAGDVLRKTIIGSGSETMVYVYTYDTQRRKTSEISPGHGEVTFSYNTTLRTKTTTFPDDSYKVEETYIDGRLKSITGNAVVNEFHHYYLSQKEGQEGFIVHETRIGSDNNSPENSPRVTTETKDWLGRVVERTVPAAHGQGNTPQVETYHYHPDTGLLIKKEITNGPTTLYRYNQFGELIEEAIRVDPSLAGAPPIPGSSDRITRTTYEYKAPSTDEDLGLWYKETKTYTFADDSDDNPSPTPILTGTVKDYIIDRSKLTGPNANLRSYTTTLNGDGHTSWQKTWVYPEEKRTVTEIGGDGVGTTTTTYINGLLVETQNPDGLSYKTHYDDLWRVSANEDPRTGNTTLTYVEGTNMVRESHDPAGNLISRNHYDSMGRVIQVDDALGKSMYTQYSSRGEPLRIWGQTTNPVSYTYDQYGVKIGMRTYRNDTNINWAETTTWPSQLTDNTGDLTQWHYHPATGLLLSKTDAANKTVSYTYDQLARVKTKTLAREVSPGVPLTLTYHYYDGSNGTLNTGQLKTVSYNDQVTPTVSYTYNRLGNIKTVTESNIGTRHFSYNTTYPWRVETEQLPAYLGNRLLTQLYQDGSNNTVPGRIAGYRVSQAAVTELQQTYTYNPSNARISNVTASNADEITTRTYNYQYHAQAPLLSGMSIDDSSFTVTRHFDPHRNLVTQLSTQAYLNDGSQPGTHCIIRNDYRHDPLGRRDHIMHQGKAYSDYGPGKALLRHIGYSDRSEVIQDDAYLVSNNTTLTDFTPDPSTALSNRHYRYAYDAFGNRKSSSFDGDQTQADYTTNNLNQYIQRNNVGTPISGTAAEDANIITHEEGNISDIQKATRQGCWWSSTLPNTPQGRLATFALISGIPGNPDATDTYKPHTHTQLIPPALQEYTHDEDGNLTSDGLYHYHWDAHDRLVKIQTTYLASQYGTPSREIRYIYDYLGRRIGKKIAEGETLLTETRYIYKGWDLIAEYNAQNNQAHQLQRSYAWGLDISVSLTGAGGVGALLQIHDHQQNKTYHPAYDGNGNVMALYDRNTQTLAASYEYSPYGELIRATGPYSKQNPIRFATKYTDDETGLIYYNKRYYSPDMGRFINRDPIEEKGGLNLYAYCNNNAINHYDILGMVTDYYMRALSAGGESLGFDTSWLNSSAGETGYYEYETEGENVIRIYDLISHRAKNGNIFGIPNKHTIRVLDGVFQISFFGKLTALEQALTNPTSGGNPKPTLNTDQKNTDSSGREQEVNAIGATDNSKRKRYMIYYSKEEIEALIKRNIEIDKKYKSVDKPPSNVIETINNLPKKIREAIYNHFLAPNAKAFSGGSTSITEYGFITYRQQGFLDRLLGASGYKSNYDGKFQQGETHMLIMNNDLTYSFFNKETKFYTERISIQPGIPPDGATDTIFWHSHPIIPFLKGNPAIPSGPDLARGETEPGVLFDGNSNTVYFFGKDTDQSKMSFENFIPYLNIK